MDQAQLFLSSLSSLLIVTVLSLLFAALGALFKQTLFYGVAYVLPIIWMIPALLIPGMPSVSWSWYAWLFVVLFTVWVIYVLRGSRRGWYSEVIQPRRSVWITFGAIVLLTLLAVTSGFFNVRSRAIGLNILPRHLTNALEDTMVKAETLSESAAELSKKEVMEDEASKGQKEALVILNAKYVDWQATIVISMTNAFSATLALEETLDVQGPEQKESELALPTLEEIQRKHNLDTVKTILPIAEAIQMHARSIDSASSPIVGDIIFQVEEIEDLADALQRTAPVFDSWDPIPVVLVLSVFVLFLLMPWLLYLSFILSKRSTTVRDRRATLRDLEIEDRFVNSSTSLILDEGGIAKEVANYLLNAEEILREDNPTDRRSKDEACYELEKALEELCPRDSNEMIFEDERKADYAENERRNATLDSSTDLFRLERRINVAKKTLNLLDVQTATDLAIDILVKQRRFHSREYIVPLLILTLLTLIGWYYIALPNTVRGLIEFVNQGSGITAFTDMLTGYFTPVTMAFAGAWLFIIIMLTHRWVTNDLYPKSYFYSALRLVTAFIVGLVFTAISSTVHGAADWLILPLAFAVGASPIEWIRAMWRAFGRAGSSIKNILRDNKLSNAFWGEAVQEFKPQDWGSKHSLTELDDVTIWDDTRLHQEGVNNVHALATVDLDRLIISTPYDAQTLIDWVDQALLFIHAKDLWRPGFAAIGIRNATDFLNYAWNDEDNGFNLPEVASITNAYNHANVATERPGDPRNKACSSATELMSGAAELAAKQDAVSDTADKLDNIKSLQMDLKELNVMTVSLQEMRGQVLEKLSGIQSGGTKLGLAKQAFQIAPGTASPTNLADKLQEIKDRVEAAQEAAKEDKLSRAKLRAQNNSDALNALSETQAMIVSLAESVNSEPDDKADKAKQKFDEAKTEFNAATGQTNDTDKRFFETAETQLEDILINIGELKTAVDNANKSAQALKGNDPSTWDQLKKLRGELGENGLKKAVDAIPDFCAATIAAVKALGESCSTGNAVCTLQALEKSQAKASKSVKLVLDEIPENSSLDDLVPLENKSNTACVDADTLASETKSIAEEILRILAQTEITPEIVQIMLVSMDRDPNIMYMRNFWKNRRGSAHAN